MARVIVQPFSDVWRTLFPYSDLIVINAYDGKVIPPGGEFAIPRRRPGRFVASVRSFKRARLWLRDCGDAPVSQSPCTGPREFTLDLPIRHTHPGYFLRPVVIIPT